MRIGVTTREARDMGRVRMEHWNVRATGLDNRDAGVRAVMTVRAVRTGRRPLPIHREDPGD